MDSKPKYKILYVDDEQMSLKYFAQALEDKFEIITASSADEGLGKLQKHGHEIGVLVTDQRMPGKLGVELLKQARAYYPNIVRILTTAHSDLNSAIQATNKGAIFHYISKPWNLDELESVMRRAMNFFNLKIERDGLLREKISTIQRTALINKIESLLVWAQTNKNSVQNGSTAVNYIVDSIQVDPGAVVDYNQFYGQDYGRWNSNYTNLNLVESLTDSEVIKGIDQLAPGEGFEPAACLSNLREAFPQIICAITTLPNESCENSEIGLRLCTAIKQMVNCWMPEADKSRILEVGETADTRGGPKWFTMRCSSLGEKSPESTKANADQYCGNNFDATKELAWFNMAFLIAHCGGEVEVDELSNDHFSLRLRFDNPGIKYYSATQVVDRLLNRIENWVVGEVAA